MRANDDDDVGETIDARIATSPLPLGSRLGRYVLLELLGKGGMAMVYRAYDPELHRDVAVKVLRVDRQQRERAHARLQREAQALARLSHPNVIAVHDVGAHGDDVFIAMELVAGKTLRDWLKEARRSVAEILAVMLAAGRGLAAAHAVGLVHRDFKPGNVMIGDDGRVRVLDFGLARRGPGDPPTPPAPVTPGGPSSATPPPRPPRPGRPGPTTPPAAETTAEAAAVAVARPDPNDAADASAEHSLLDRPLTRADVLVGTPAYMAPEQFGGGTADERSDQFSFGVTLYEALYGARPYANPGSPRGDLPWTLRTPPGEVRVPAWLRAVALRAIELEPARRYPSMHDLLEALERDQSARRRRIAAAAAAGVALVAAGMLAMRGARAPAPPCQPTGDELGAAWNPGRKDEVGRAFVASGHPQAADRFVRFAGAVDDYAGRWAAMRVEACRATRVTGSQSEVLLDLRMACLERQRRRLGAMTDLHAGRLDREMVDAAPATAYRLGDLDRCADSEALLGAAPAPRDPGQRAMVEAVRRRLDDLEALHEAGRSADAREPVRTLAAEAAATGDPRLRAQAAALAGDIATELADHAAAKASYYDAARLAAEAHDDELVASTWIDLVYVVGYREARLDEGEAMLRVAEAAVARAGGDEVLRLALLHRRAVLAYVRGRVADARRDFEEGVAIAEAIYRGDHPRLADMLVSLGNTFRAPAELPTARAHHERATGIYERALGPDHPRLTFGLENLGTVLERLGDHRGAIALFERVVGICERSYGPDHPDVAHALANLGSALVADRRPAEAVPHLERALGLTRAALGPDHPDTAQVHFQLGRAAEGRGDRAMALEHHRRALAIRAAAQPADHHDVIASRAALAALGAPAP